MNLIESRVSRDAREAEEHFQAFQTTVQKLLPEISREEKMKKVLGKSQKRIDDLFQVVNSLGEYLKFMSQQQEERDLIQVLILKKLDNIANIIEKMIRSNKKSKAKKGSKTTSQKQDSALESKLSIEKMSSEGKDL